MSELEADNTFVFGEECLAYKKSEADKVIAEKDKRIAELNDKLRHYPMMAVLIEGANKEICRLKRALYKACANWAKSERYTEATWHGDEHREELWAEVQDKCLKKAEEYK